MRCMKMKAAGFKRMWLLILVVLLLQTMITGGQAQASSAVFIVGNPSLGAGDAAVKTAVEGLGFTVTVIDDGDCDTSDATGQDLILISSTVGANKVGNKFRTVTVPVVVWETAIYDDMDLTTSEGTVNRETQIDITDSSHDMAAGLSGTVTVFSSNETVSYGVPNANADIVATVAGDSSKPVIFGYETGATMVNSYTAPARRAAAYINSDGADVWTTDGQDLFEAIVTWATSTPSNQAPVADAGTDQTVSDSDDNGSETVTLDGSNSSDADGTITSYVWEENSSQIATGVNPNVSFAVGAHTVTLTVTDDDLDTDTDTVVITVNAYMNVPPTADAGPDQNVSDTDESGDEQVTLDGSGSSDSDGTIVSYVWEENSTQIATGVSPSVTLDVGSHTIMLTVTDDDSDTDTDTVVISVGAASQDVQLDITAGFNMDAWCGPKEFQELRLDGTQDLIELFGTETSGLARYVWDQQDFMPVNSSGAGMEYSISGDVGHPLYLSGTEGTPADGIVTGAGGRVYHIAGSTGNATVSGDATEVADPSTYVNNPNCLYVGSAHNINDFQIASVTVELPANQKAQYDNVNFVLCAAKVADLARNMQIVALYGDGTDEEILYSFSTADGGSGPRLIDTSYTGFSSVYTMTKKYSGTTGYTGVIRDGTANLWEFNAPIDLNSGKTLYGFRIEDTNPTLNWNQRAVIVFAATATTATGSNALPDADAGSDQLVHAAGASASVTLDGTGSTDSDGTITDYSWVENSVEIATGAQPVISLAVGSHTIELTVTDNDNGTDSDTVVIDVNALPVADAGSDQLVYDEDSSGSESVTLDGGASSDSDGSIVGYSWKENSTEIATGSSPAVSLAVGQHTIELTVTDDDGGTATDTVDITVSDNHPPVADAGSDQNVTDTNGDGSETVSLSASGSSDSDGTITDYAWYDSDGTQLSTSSSFNANLPLGMNDIKLVVTDDDGATVSDVVRIWVYPDADYWVDQNDPGASDSNDGSAATPWLTISHAVSNVSPGDVIMVRQGIYRERPNITVSGASGSPITLMGYPGERVVISGADEVTGWTQCSQAIAKNNPNYADIYYVDVAWKPTRLVQDEVDLEIAATPWMGWRLCEGGANNTLIDTANLTEADDFWNGATVYLWDIGSTVQYSHEVTDYDYSSGTLTISGTWSSNTAIVPESLVDIYQLQNKVELINAAGQWAVEDMGGGTYRLYCWANGDGDPDSYTMEASRRDRFVLELGVGSYWVIDNLELRHGTNYGMGSWSGSFAGNVTVQNCVIHHNDSTGIYGDRNVNGKYLRNVIIYNGLGMDNGGESNVLFEENEIAWNAVDGLRTIGPNDGTNWAEYVTARRNYIHDHYKWSHADNCQAYGQIRYMDIEDNLIISSGQSYMMEATESSILSGNTVIGSQAYMLIYGHGNVGEMTTDHNTLAYAGYGLVNHSGSDGYYHSNNIVLKGNAGSCWGNVDSVSNYTSDYNVFYIGPNLTNTPVIWTGTSDFAGYQAVSGEDANSVQADPLFTNAPAYYSALATSKQYLFTNTRVYLPTGNIGLFEVGDYIEIDWDGIQRTVTAVGSDYIDFTPGSTRIGFKANQVTNWKDNTNYTLDFTLKAGSPATGNASDASDIGSSINIQQYMDCDFNGDGRRDIPAWPGQ